MMVFRRSLLLLVAASIASACGEGSQAPTAEVVPATTDPGTGPWEPVPRDRVLEECGLDPDLLERADAAIDRPWAAVRYGKLCHEFYPEGEDSPTHLFSATKTMSAIVLGMAAWETRNLERTGRKTGPISAEGRVDHWLDEFSFNPDARIEHVLAMVAFNASLEFGDKVHRYDASGAREINRLSDVIRTAIMQDPKRLGRDVEEFWQRHMVGPLGLRDSTWSGGAPDKILGYSWYGSVQDMARVGLLINNKGVWNGRRLLGERWIYSMTHPAFEDANTGYGWLTWLSAKANHNFGGILGGTKFQSPLDPCAPPALHGEYPHGISASPDCGYGGRWSCEQEYDAGVWFALGAGGQIITGHPGLDLVLVGKDLGQAAFASSLWGPVRPALVAADPSFQGDEEAFCEEYGNSRYAPDLR